MYIMIPISPCPFFFEYLVVSGVTVASRILEFQRRIKRILIRGSKDSYMNFIGKKSAEAASIHSKFQRIFPLNITEPSTQTYVLYPFTFSGLGSTIQRLVLG